MVAARKEVVRAGHNRPVSPIPHFDERASREKVVGLNARDGGANGHTEGGRSARHAYQFIVNRGVGVRTADDGPLDAVPVFDKGVRRLRPIAADRHTEVGRRTGHVSEFGPIEFLWWTSNRIPLRSVPDLDKTVVGGGKRAVVDRLGPNECAVARGDAGHPCKLVVIVARAFGVRREAER